MKRYGSCVLLGFLLLPIGCGGPPSDPVRQALGTAKSELLDRYEAAKGISNVEQKDQALAAVAASAAKEWDAEVVKKCIQAISNVGTKDDAAAGAAVELAKGGKAKEGAAVANLISNVSRKDETLAKIAKGE